MSNTNLHLPSLSISDFCGIEKLCIPRLGGVTLLAGKNSVGKTTVLDAVRLYAARGHPGVLQGIIRKREELVHVTDEDGDPIVVPDFSALFHGRNTASQISIGSSDSSDELTLKETLYEEWPEEEQLRLPDIITEVDAKPAGLKIEFQGKKKFISLWDFPEYRRMQVYRRRFRRRENWQQQIRCESIGPDLSNNGNIPRWWDRITMVEAEVEAEAFVIQALQLALDDKVEKINMVGDDGDQEWVGRRAMIKLERYSRPVPLRSLGDGAGRLFGTALSLFGSQGGFLLIDEAENGIHYNIQSQFWRMIFQSAERHNIQVFATTHSFDCIRGFAQAAIESKIEGTLIRLTRDGQELKAVEYSEEGLQAAAEQGIEVR